MLTKEAAAEVLGRVPGTLRALSSEIAVLRQENEGLKEKIAQSSLASEIVDMMDRKGLSEEGIDHQTKIATLLGSGKDLAVMKQALQMSAPNMSYSSLGTTDDLSKGDAFVAAIMGG